MEGGSEIQNIPEDVLEILKNTFGHAKFRQMQWAVISAILNEKIDTYVLMATGYGKSLCYQFPSVYRNGITIVVSPLISLMQDQVLGLNFNNIPSCFLGSAQTDRDTFSKVTEGNYNIVYVTPEYITSETGKSLLKIIESELILIAIDEAHCISKWGHDFRAAYRKLSDIRQVCPSVPILATTATATKRVRDDIIHSLRLRNPKIISTGFDRPNLKFMVKKKKDIWLDIGPLVRNVNIGSIIIYCISRKITEQVSTVLSSNGINCFTYHAGLSLKQRNKAHEDFIHDRFRVIVATIAFGMGINKPDVRIVIHYGVPKDMESYYQEAGRAGRDGLPSTCIMFHQEKDWRLHELIRNMSSQMKTSLSTQVQIESVRKYINTTECRRRFILSYFGEDDGKLTTRADCCDNCSNTRCTPAKSTNLYDKYHGLDQDGLLDITDEAFKILSIVHEIRGNYGLRKVTLMLRGSRSQSTPDAALKHPFFGCLKDKSEKWTQMICNELLAKRMLEIKAAKQTFNQNTIPYRLCYVSHQGQQWLNNLTKRNPIKITPNEEIISMLRPKIVPQTRILNNTTPALPVTTLSSLSNSCSTSTEAISTNLVKPTKPNILHELVKVRTKLANLYDIMPYLIASTKALEQLAVLQPTTLDELKKIEIDGYTEDKKDRFGPVFVKVIKDHQAKLKSNQTNIGGLKENSDKSNVANKTGYEQADDQLISSDSEIDDMTLQPSSISQSSLKATDQNNIIEVWDSDIDELELNQVGADVENSINNKAKTPPNDTDWEIELDESDLSQVTDLVEQEHDKSLPLSTPTTELDLLIEAVELDATKNDVPKTKPKSRAVFRKLKPFEYEDDSSSDSEEGNQAKAVNQKRVLPNWIHSPVKRKK